MDGNVLAQLAFSGLVTGSLYALVAMSYGIVVRATEVFNIAQGEFLMLGAYVTWYSTSSAGLPFWLAASLAVFVVVGASILAQRAVIRPLMGQSMMTIVMVTIGLSFVVRGGTAVTLGATHSILHLPLSNTPWIIGPLRVTPTDIVMLSTSVVLIVGLFVFFQRTRLGLGMRATASRQDVAELMGVRVERVHAISWGLAGIVAAAAGIMLGAMQNVSPFMGGIAFKAFPALFIGGIDNIAGGIVGGLAVGLIENLIGGGLDVAFNTGIKEMLAYVLLVLILVVRPYGFFGQKAILRI